ncbi:MAG TPA: tetratricopeptide repeat protein [Spirochaetota bacterium]|nr:tetratricopeptide repeat protein [Spirochaetota bacterium]HPC39499.1 tetratricopeptide repeat protein [Spirochaetota bacterium]HQF06836.1 tetratricopeptide repeat protein [Spirochaetota bacterium]HQH95545.1 tetratricopeptide repeat protein [Spirochaetota bacterium]HQJ69123.1 tetratricopeptide repeat protein [Spirochaetota bacterium]
MAEIDLQDRIDDFLRSAMKKFVIRDYESAIRDLKAAEMLDKNNPEILYNIGINYCRMGLDRSAIEYFKKVLNLKQSFIDALTVKKLLAYALIRLKQYEESLGILQQVLQLVPMDTAALNMKGYSLESMGRYDEALRVFSYIIEHEKDNYNAYNSLGYILSKTGANLAKALQCAQIAYNSNNDNPAYLDTMGYVYLKMGKIELARKYLIQALEKAPLSADIKDHIKECENNRTVIR